MVLNFKIIEVKISTLPFLPLVLQKLPDFLKITLIWLSNLDLLDQDSNLAHSFLMSFKFSLYSFPNNYYQNLVWFNRIQEICICPGIYVTIKDLCLDKIQKIFFQYFFSSIYIFFFLNFFSSKYFSSIKYLSVCRSSKYSLYSPYASRTSISSLYSSTASFDSATVRLARKQSNPTLARRGDS